MDIYANGSISFVQDCFKNIKNLTYFAIHNIKFITFAIASFQYSNVHEIEIWTYGEVSFVQSCFQNCTNLESLAIHTSANFIFGDDAFLNSQKEELNITSGNV